MIPAGSDTPGAGSTEPAVPPVLEVENLTAGFTTDMGDLTAVDGVSFSIARSACFGLVGESGCGKSVTALSVMRLLPKPSGWIRGGRILLNGQNLTSLSPMEMAAIRGRRVSMIFQEPMTALNPVHRIGKQIGEIFRIHFPEMKKSDIRNACLSLLEQVDIPEPARRLTEYPHQLSGGMRQRVMIAMALACEPDLLIADEPTTALDVTIQAQILDLIRTLQRKRNTAVLFITHDLGVVAELCDEVAVMYGGRIAETAPVRELFRRPAHPYTRGLLAAVTPAGCAFPVDANRPAAGRRRKPRLPVIPGSVPSLADLPGGCRFQSRCSHAREICRTRPELRPMGTNHTAACHFAGKLPKTEGTGTIGPVRAKKATPGNEGASAPSTLLEVTDLVCHFPVHSGVFRRRTGTVHAVDGVSFSIGPGETLGLVGESGCGKTTVGRTLLRLYRPQSGRVSFDGTDIARLRGRDLRRFRRSVRMVFQDPFESLNARHTAGAIIEEIFQIHDPKKRMDHNREVRRLLDLVGLPADAADRYPHEFSGGQRQRVGIARAIALNPRLMICDEPVSALDVSIQSQIVNLFLDLQDGLGLSCLFISHDLSVVRHVSDRVLVMYLGRIVESAPTDRLFARPLHPYTQALLSAAPAPDPDSGSGRRKDRIILSGDVPSPLHPPSGCRFRTRCPLAVARCREETPVLAPRAPQPSAPRPESGISPWNVQMGNEQLAACFRAGETASFS